MLRIRYLLVNAIYHLLKMAIQIKRKDYIVQIVLSLINIFVQFVSLADRSSLFFR